MTVASAYALGLALLGAWGVFTARRSFKAAGRWSERRGPRRWRGGRIFLVDLVFVGSCFVSAAGLALGWFRAWLLLPLGASFLAMIPLPCYFNWVDRIGWVRAARNALFIVVAMLCVAVGFRLLPLSLFGL